MKVIIPLAGKGTRLRPHTHTVPKPMLKVAGKPVMDYVMDDVAKLGNVEQVIYITGHLKGTVEAHARTAFNIPGIFVEQLVQDGTAGAVELARPFVDQPVLIIFVDTIFDTDLAIINDSTDDGIIWTKEVEDYQRFGVVVTDAAGHMTRIVEKPSTPISKRANIGLYYIRNWKLLYEGIAHVLQQPANKGEYYLTDAFQYMIDKGAKIRVVDVAGWYDAGKLDTLLDTNRVMLEQGRSHLPSRGLKNVEIVDPVRIEDGARVTDCILGPNVVIGRESVVSNCTMRDTIIGDRSTLSSCILTDSMVGDQVLLEGITGSVSLGDHTEVRAPRL
ncbi:MAG: NTP transferase domain-containing protein [Gemmatimonadetes bacterium]|nr:NTP transferase domain-containing protein [Gemmatimonadota bacterium]